MRSGKSNLSEADLYEPIRQYLVSPQFTEARKGLATKEYRMAKVTADVSWLDDAGDWMRPDVIMAHAYRRTFDARGTLNLHAIEIKKKNVGLTSGLFQALSYSRIADYCYLAAPKGSMWTPRIKELAKRFGVGLIEFDATSIDLSVEFQPARKMQPDLDLRDDYLRAVFPNGTDREQFLEILG